MDFPLPDIQSSAAIGLEICGATGRVAGAHSGRFGDARDHPLVGDQTSEGLLAVIELAVDKPMKWKPTGRTKAL